jgi:hypothetical protein
MHIKLMTGAAAFALLLPIAAYAQSGAAAGATAGAVGGAVVGGPVGAVVGGVGGALVGTITDANQPKFREYVVREHHPSYHYDREVVVGAELPATGVTYWEIPRDYGTTEYRYTIVNDRTVIVDPKTHRIVQIIG